jgi:hypothetical protein
MRKSNKKVISALKIYLLAGIKQKKKRYFYLTDLYSFTTSLNLNILSC